MYGIVIKQNEETGLISINAVSNISVPGKISFAVYEITSDDEKLINSKKTADGITFSKQPGKIKIKAFYEDAEQTNCTVDFKENS